jgi:N-acyl-D-aspartate/D-glutamate deacylase
MLDVKIEGATVVDGTGTAGGRTDVGIRDDAIVALGDLSREPAARTLNASSKVVTPGFIDIHSHSDWTLWANRRAESKIRQGVTTEVVGNCGFSPAPVAADHLEDLRELAPARPRGLDFRWRSMEEYFGAFDAQGTALNVVHLVGHGALRIAAMGVAAREPTAGELRLMQDLLAAAMEAGAWGLSTGLVFPPGSYATRAEVVALARVAARHRGFYGSHVHGEDEALLDTVGEAIQVGRQASLAVQLSHLKAAGRPNGGTMARALALIDTAVAEGIDVMADIPPYPPADDGRSGATTSRSDERNLRQALVHPRVMIGSDGSALAPYGDLGDGHHHPRSYGTFPRVLGLYAREERLLSLPQAVHKMTGLPARRLGLRDRGVIRVGAKADLVVLDPRAVADAATDEAPHRYPRGIEHVLVNGRFVIRHGEHTGSLPGTLIKNL